MPLNFIFPNLFEYHFPKQALLTSKVWCHGVSLTGNLDVLSFSIRFWSLWSWPLKGNLPKEKKDLHAQSHSNNLISSITCWKSFQPQYSTFREISEKFNRIQVRNNASKFFSKTCSYPRINLVVFFSEKNWLCCEIFWEHLFANWMQQWTTLGRWYINSCSFL